MYKSEQEEGLPPIPEISTVTRQAHQVLAGTWATEISKEPTTSRIPTAGWDRATNLSLPHARQFITKAIEPLTIAGAHQAFNPPVQLRFSSETLPSLHGVSLDEKAVTLTEVESWIEKHLCEWVNHMLGQPGCVDNLATLMDDYWKGAVIQYRSIPLEMSNAILVMLELWVALDRICISRIPLLQKYSPEISSHMLSPLLLPKHDQMCRLSRIENYIKGRHRSADKSLSGVFASPSNSSFSNLFYDSSAHLQQLHRRIVQSDKEKRAKKLEELDAQTRRYNELKSYYTPESHTHWGKPRHWEKRCEACRSENEANRMLIYVDEKSLPENLVQLKAAIFELAVPVEFAAWRDSTWLMIYDLSQEEASKRVDMYQLLGDYGQLRQFAEPRSRPVRLTLGSTTKSVSRTHWGKKSFPTTREAICVNNALRYEMFDTSGDGRWLSDATATPGIKDHCTFVLPPGPYANLGWALGTSSHTENQVMAYQNTCHYHLELREYVAFCSLRAGERLQWPRILREYGCSNLTWNDPAVTTLILQAIWEAGSFLSDVHREAHSELLDQRFCKKLLDTINKKFASIKSNWQEQSSMMAISQIVLRILSLTSTDAIETECLQLLTAIRKVCLSWCTRIREHMSDNFTLISVQEKTVDQLLSAALLCHSTFDVDECQVSRLLSCVDNVSILAEAQMIICETSPADQSTLPDNLQQTLLHHTKISHKLENHVRRILIADGTGLNQAIRRVWNGAYLVDAWESASNEATSWLRNRTLAVNGRQQTVHFHLLGGDLLVDGEPVGKLPSSVKSHPLCKQIFGSAILNVFSSNMPGMRYTVSQHMNGHEVHIGVRDKQVLVKTRSEHGIFQALPQTAFTGQLPLHFVQSFTHWLNETNGVVEFRPIDRPWHMSSNLWRLTFSSLDFLKAESKLRSGKERLLENQSPIGKSVSATLAPLDTAENCHIVLRDDRPHELHVCLRRYNLHFLVKNNGEVMSLEYKAIVDPDQNINTLVGLRNKLVLRDASAVDGLHERRLIIPYGVAHLLRSRYHVSVTIEHGFGDKQRHFVYTLDRHLRKLRGQQDILSTLHKAYLHAVTSFNLPDPFTGRTGTEESISILKEASLFSSVPLAREEISVLNRIAALTPSRHFYPSHKRVMQRVRWNPQISPLSQHDDFQVSANAIFDHHRNTESFFDVERTLIESRGDALLLDRARKRNLSIMRSGLYAKLRLTEDDDNTYASRDDFRRTIRASQVFDTAALIKQWPSQTGIHGNLTEVIKTWGKVAGYNAGSFKICSLQDLSTLVIKEHFGSMYELCRKASQSSMTFALTFKFCAIALGADNDKLLDIRTLLAFAFTGAFQMVDPPPRETLYRLNRGLSPSSKEILEIINRNRKQLGYPDNATHAQAVQVGRQKREQDDQALRLSRQIISEWPAKTLTVGSAEYTHIFVPNAVTGCQDLFDEWHNNCRLIAHVDVVRSRLVAVQTKHNPRPIPAKGKSRHSTETMARNVLLPDLWQQIQKRSPKLPNVFGVHTPRVFVQPPRSFEDVSRVRDLLSSFDSTSSHVHHRYKETLRSSIEALGEKFSDLESEMPPLNAAFFEEHRSIVTKLELAALQEIQNTLAPLSVAESVLDDADLWPRSSEQCLLTLLSADSFSRLSGEWKDCLLNLGEKVSSVQRSERMMKFYQASNCRKLWSELKHPGRENWSANEQPGWLLLEIENNITIRPLQAKVAREMMLPSSKTNSVLQLNMGEGKSSVIIPMLATALADGEHLVRVVVLKSLLHQTEQVLTQRLGGLLNQRVGHVPFSRKTRPSTSDINTLSDTFLRCAQNRGVLIVVPEEILSMQLMTREKMSSDLVSAAEMLRMQRWLDGHARDILDESDEILSVRSQLIYPVGSQQMLDGKSDRWQLSQAVLERVHFHAERLAKSFPNALELDYNGKMFPLLKFLDPSIGEGLTEMLAQDALDGRIAGLSFDFYTDETRKAVRSYISCRDVPEQDLAVLAKNIRNGPHWSAILILRGLLAHGVLQFTLQKKRWLVEYGLDARRCAMAVPYRAKGVPSSNSEFGHPDVAISLTCLSYYYTGLTLKQMHVCFKLLAKESNPQEIYSAWASAYPDLPEDLRSLDAINLDDKALCENTLFPKMQFNMQIIAFYLNQIVFPKEGKEFAKRISASGWDIPSSSHDPKLLTTGFSGTNDSREILPFSIKQHDISDLCHTNALVLNLVLRKENQTYVQGVDKTGQKLDVNGLVSLISRQVPRINVLIDVGAQVLEATNNQLAKDWLAIDDRAQAALFFDEHDEAMILDRSDSVTPLRISPFQGNLDSCVIYLDEVHTRGIDLAIPIGARAAITLGPRLVKDRLMQGEYFSFHDYDNGNVELTF